jgi:NitT/TauT family transport system substrate-binding protein
MGRKTVHLVGAVLLGALAAGCASAGGGSASGSGGGGGSVSGPGAVEKPNLTVAAEPVADDVGLFIAADRGMFRAAGLNVKIVPVVTSADAIRLQNEGGYDITAGNSVSYVQAQVRHEANLEVIAEGSLMQPGNQALYTLEGSSIGTIEELKGHRIGVNALDDIGTLLIGSVLEAHGVTPRQVHFVPVNFPIMVQALQNHAIDAAWLPEPFGSADTAIYGLQELADLDQGATTSFPVAWYVATKAWAKKYPRTLAAFLAVLKQAQQLADTNRVFVQQAMENLPTPYAVPDYIADVMTVETYPLSVAPDINRGRVQRVANAMYQFQMLSRPFKTSSMLG